MSVLSWSGTRFTFLCSPGEAQIPKALGFHYDSNNKFWWTGLISIARNLEIYADDRAKGRFYQEQDIIKQSWATDANINIPAPEGRSYLGFQKAGIGFSSRRKDTLIADQMGLGKTIQALGLINLIPDIKKVLIIPPASLRLNWGKESKRWLVRNMSGGYAYSNHFPDTDIVIINYDIVQKFRKDSIDKIRWDLVIMDEAHYLKNPETRRTKAVLGYEYWGKHVSDPIDAGMKLFLTGTPILSRPIELWPIVRNADSMGLGVDHWLFVQKFCKAWEAPWGWDYSGADHLDELQERLRSSIMIRRLKKDVLKELPPKRRQIISIPPETASAVIKREVAFYEQHEKDIDSAVEKAAIDQSLGDEASYRHAALELEANTKPLFSQMARLRFETAMAKIPFVISFLEDVLQQEDKVVVFAHHHEVVDQIHAHFSKIAVKMHGGILHVADRQQAVDSFQEDPKIRLIVGSIGTMGVGWTLTAASYCLFAELDWVPALITQSEDRLHRIGQLESVLIHHFCFDGSLDARMAQVVVEKQDVIDRALDK